MTNSVKLVFLGTGASVGTPGLGKSKRSESSLLIEYQNHRLLIDVTRFFAKQSKLIPAVDSILITHGHQDACGGIAKLHSWWKQRHQNPIPLFSHSKTIARIQLRFKRLNHLKFQEVKERESKTIGPWQTEAIEVPHEITGKFSTFAWKLKSQKTKIVYASDIAVLTPSFKKFCQKTTLLIIDAAMWRKKIFAHLTINKQLPELCSWNVQQIILTQIGQTAPPHEILEKEVKKLCPKTFPAYDGMKFKLAV